MTTNERLYSWKEWRDFKRWRDADLGLVKRLAFLAAVGVAFADDGIYPASAAEPAPLKLDDFIPPAFRQGK